MTPSWLKRQKAERFMADLIGAAWSVFAWIVIGLMLAVALGMGGPL